ncbi:MAG TPA: hypothetical protein VHO02_00970, partial [Fibrobacteria bacterium]|nr:hypothetical protein [Fibrobacteria bacterium]
APDSTGAAADSAHRDSAKQEEVVERRFELYDISEKGLPEVLWKLSEHGEGEELEEAPYRVLFFSDSLPEAYLIRGGTQVGRLPDSSLPLLREKIRSGGLKRGGESGFWKNFWNPGDPLQPFMWETGLDVRLGTSVLVTRHASPQYERRYDMTFVQSPFPWVFTELGGHFATYGGGLRRNIYDPMDDASGYAFWGSPSPWWHVALGVPGVKWEVALANRAFPELYWLEPNAGQASYMAGRSHIGVPLSESDIETDSLQRGKLMREWSRNGDPIPSGRNLSHTLQLKAGSLRYSAYIDPDVYRSVVHRAYFGDLQGPLGTWGFGFFLANGIGQTFLNFDVAPWGFRFGEPADGNYFRFSLLHLELAYRDNERFHIGLATRVMLDSRAFSYGDRP